MSFFNELKRRNVFRVGAAYLVVSWLLLQVVDTVAPILDLPEIFSRGVLLLLAIFFPIFLIVAWLFELTPEGLQTQAAADESGARTYSGKLNTLIISGLALVIVMLVVDNYVLVDETPASEAAIQDRSTPDDEIIRSTAEERSIAVLPFADLSPEGDQEWFADGLSEELLNRLARIQDLQVAARTSSFYYKGLNEDLRVIGQELGVAHILEGSVRKAGNQIRVTAQLIKADDGFHLWSDTFDADMEDIFRIQDEIADAVSTALSVTLAAGEFNREGMTRNVQAYEEYLRGLERGGRPVESINNLRRAVEIDPAFGLAWIELRRSYSYATLVLPANESADYVQLARQALERARDLIPDSPDFLIADASAQRRQGNWIDAETSFLSALDQLGNSSSLGNLNYGELLWSVGRVEDALPYLERARRLDPKSGDVSARLAAILLSLGRTEEARQEAERGLENEPTNGFTSFNRLLALLGAEDYETVLDEMSAQPGAGPLRSAMEYFVERDFEAAGQTIREFLAGRNLAPVVSTAFVPFLTIAGDPETALTMLGDSYNQNLNDPFGGFPMWQPFVSNMRQLEGFKELAEMAGVANYWRTTGNWGDFCRPLEGSDDFECYR